MNVDIGGNFKFPMGEEGQQYEQTYKLLIEYLNSGNLQQLLGNNTLVNAFAKYGQLNINQLKKDFSWGSGTTIKIVDHPGNSSLFPNVRGNTPIQYDGEVIEISKRLVELLESSKQEDKEAALWWIVKVLFHEKVHRGNLIAGHSGNGNYDEVGNEFDDDI